MPKDDKPKLDDEGQFNRCVGSALSWWNHVEGYFSILKRGINGAYHHVSQKHLRRYLGEFDFRYNQRMGLGISDTERAKKALKGIEGKRLTYRRTGAGQAA